MLCADIVELRWQDAAGRLRRDRALLEDIALHGACLHLEAPLPLDTAIVIEHPKARMEAVVRYCVYRDIGYFVGVQFTAGSEWSTARFTPKHLLDLERLVMRGVKKARQRGNVGN